MQTPKSTDFEASMPPGDGGSQPTSRAAEIGRKAAAAIDQKRDSLARGIDSAASTLHANAGRLPGGEKIGRAAHTTAAAMERAADYVRDQDVEAMLDDAQQAVKRHPGAVLLIAGAVGFLLARAFSRN